MNMEYDGELTFTQLIRIIRRGLLKWVICVAAVFVVTFAVTYSVYSATAVVGYTLTMVYTEAPKSPEAEMAAMISVENIKEALENVGYTDDEIESEGLAEKISGCLSVSLDEKFGEYTFHLSGRPLDEVTDEKYNAILNEIARAYARDYRAQNTYIVPSGVADIDVSGVDYIIAADYLTEAYTVVLESVSRGLASNYTSSYVDSETGYNFYDLLNMFEALSSKVELFRLYVENNAAMKDGVSVSAKEYIYSKLTDAESAYVAAARDYNTLVEAFKQGNVMASNGTVQVDSSFYELIEEMRTASSDLGTAETDVIKWRNTWLAFGGTVIYNDDGSASYSAESFAGNYSTGAETILSDTIAAVKETYEIYNGIAERFNEKAVSEGNVNISSYSSKSVTYGMPLNMLIIINIAAVLFAFAAANAHTYAQMKKRGEFNLPETAASSEGEKTGDKAPSEEEE